MDQNKALNNSKITATFTEGDGIITMAVDDMDQEKEFPTESESGIVNFKKSSNNNATPVQDQSTDDMEMTEEYDSMGEDGELNEELDSNSEISEDNCDSDKDMETRDNDRSSYQKETNRDNLKEEIMGEAMNRFHEIFMSSDFMRTTAKMMQKSMEQGNKRGESSNYKERHSEGYGHEDGK